jgi:hypothetical protein
MLGLLVQNQSHRAGTHLRAKLIRRIPHQTFFSGEMVSANPGAVQIVTQPYRRDPTPRLVINRIERVLKPQPVSGPITVKKRNNQMCL